ncbi:MAG TPA: hypothetical protein DDZ42_13905, partial [Candidatus Rokubacteria bacterium]|nr:hypothetical protein [Candidatus Rokubacteria bacterium]
YYYRARYHSSRLGRFIAQDPLGFSAGSVNLYTYVGNSPVNSRDPLGLCPACAAPAAPLVVEAVAAAAT